MVCYEVKFTNYVCFSSRNPLSWCVQSASYLSLTASCTVSAGYTATAQASWLRQQLKPQDLPGMTSWVGFAMPIPTTHQNSVRETEGKQQVKRQLPKCLPMAVFCTYQSLCHQSQSALGKLSCLISFTDACRPAVGACCLHKITKKYLALH